MVQGSTDAIVWLSDGFKPSVPLGLSPLLPIETCTTVNSEGVDLTIVTPSSGRPLLLVVQPWYQIMAITAHLAPAVTVGGPSSATKEGQNPKAMHVQCAPAITSIDGVGRYHAVIIVHA